VEDSVNGKVQDIELIEKYIDIVDVFG